MILRLLSASGPRAEAFRRTTSRSVSAAAPPIGREQCGVSRRTSSPAGPTCPEPCRRGYCAASLQITPNSTSRLGRPLPGGLTFCSDVNTKGRSSCQLASGASRAMMNLSKRRSAAKQHGIGTASISNPKMTPQAALEGAHRSTNRITAGLTVVNSMGKHVWLVALAHEMVETTRHRSASRSLSGSGGGRSRWITTRSARRILKSLRSAKRGAELR